MVFWNVPVLKDGFDRVSYWKHFGTMVQSVDQICCSSVCHLLPVGWMCGGIRLSSLLLIKNKTKPPEHFHASPRWKVCPEVSVVWKSCWGRDLAAPLPNHKWAKGLMFNTKSCPWIVFLLGYLISAGTVLRWATWKHKPSGILAYKLWRTAQCIVVRGRLVRSVRYWVVVGVAIGWGID